MTPPPVYIAGPTASGKSALALELALRFGAEIVNADAFQLYAGMEALTAAPSSIDRASVPHHLFGILAPEHDFNAARYALQARAALADIAARGCPAIVVGGSGLYLKALTHGLDDLPSDEGLRAELRTEALESKVARLRSIDPATAAAIDTSNPRYVERALEISLLTGRPASEQRQRWSQPPDPPVRGIRLEWRRSVLIERINRRVDSILAAGAIAEVRRIDSASGFSATAGKAIGVREIRDHLAGRLSLEDTAEAIRLATRRYAKRQSTWFRREAWLEIICLEPGMTPQSIAARLSPPDAP